MTSLIAKLRSVTRYGVAVFLAALSFFSLRADVSCGPVGDPFQGTDGKWYVTVVCYGDIYSSTDVEVQAPSSSGSCTNCTAMTPEECAAVKSSVLASVSTAKENVESALVELQNAQDQCGYLVNYIWQLREGDSFEFNETPLSNSGYLSIPQSPYLYDSPVSKTRSYQGGANSIYNYYNDGVLPVLQSMQSTVDDLSLYVSSSESSLNNINSDLDSIDSYVNSMNCNACEGSGGGGGGGSSDPSTPSTGCPCAEVLEAIKTILEDLRTKQNKIQEDVEKIRKKVEGWDNYLKWIAEAVAPMGTNFIAAVEYKDLDGISFQMKTLDETLKQSGKFDFEEFGKLGWYSRVEYLLMSIAGVFSITNRPDDVDKDSLQDHVDDITGEGDSLEDRVDNVKSGFGDIKSSVSAFFTASKSAFASHSANGNVSLMTGWLGSHHLEFTIDSTVITVARTVTSLFWTVGFAFVLYLLVFRGFAFVVSVFKFWIVQAQGFLK